MKRFLTFLTLVVVTAGLVCSQVFATTALYNQTVRVVDSSGNIINSFGSGGAALSGVVTGAANANIFNTTNTAGNTMTNAFIINNAFGQGDPNLAAELTVLYDPTFAELTNIAAYDRRRFYVADLPGSCSGDDDPISEVIDATDGSCTNAGVPVGGGSHQCLVTCQSSVFKFNGVKPDGPFVIETTADTNGGFASTGGFQTSMGAWNSTTGFGGIEYFSPSINLEGDNRQTVSIGDNQSLFYLGDLSVSGDFFIKGSTSGKVKFTAPVAAGTPTVTLPATTGTMQVATVAHLAAFPSCASGTEGLYGTQDDSAVPCVAGVTAANGGSTHCAMYCNGSLWKRTGL